MIVVNDKPTLEVVVEGAERVVQAVEHAVKALEEVEAAVSAVEAVPVQEQQGAPRAEPGEDKTR